MLTLRCYLSPFLPVFSLNIIPDLSVKKQVEPGSERQAAAAERQPEQEEPGGGSDGPPAS